VLEESSANDDTTLETSMNGLTVTIEQQAGSTSSLFARSLRSENGVLYSPTAGQAVTDHLTKEEAAAVAAMLTGQVGDNISNAANLKIAIDGQVIAEADAYGNLTITNTSWRSQGLAEHFSTLAAEEMRPSSLEGVERIAAIARYNPEADGHQFMQQLANNFEALHSPDMPRVSQREGLSTPTQANASTIMNLYATKELGAEYYQLKDGGAIFARPGSEDRGDYQFFEVKDEVGNVDMAFTVCPNGMILLDPKIGSHLQSQISQMEQAWDRGLYDDDTPLMTKDKVRADVIFAFKQNVTSPAAGKKSDLPIDVKTDQFGNITAISKTDPKAKIQFNRTKEGGFRIHANSLSTPDLLEFNRAFAVQTRNQAIEAPGRTKEGIKKTVKRQTHRNQPSM
jgi:hypothetical protein